MAFHDTKKKWLSFSIHKVIWTRLGGPFFPDTVYMLTPVRPFAVTRMYHTKRLKLGL